MSYLPSAVGVFLCVAFVGSSVAQTVVNPAEFANKEGRRQSAGGVERPASVLPDQHTRAQFIYHNSTFSTVASGPIRITEINLRPDGARDVGDEQGYENLRLVLAVTSSTPQEASTSFADNLANITSEPIVVFDQPWESEVVNPVPAEGTRPFDFRIQLTEPFVFDPSEGHLMVDWFFGRPTNLGPHTNFDSDAVFGEPPTEFPEQQGVFALGDDPIGNGGQIVPTQFVFEPVPEPTLRLGTVLFVVGLASRFRKRK